MSLPEQFFRYPVGKAIDSLAERFQLPNTPWMQDWQWEVADPERIAEFLAVYLSDEPSAHERFILLEMLFQSFEESARDLSRDPQWKQTIAYAETHIDLHIYTIWYWSWFDSYDLEDCPRITPHIRTIWQRHRARFGVH